MNIPDTPIDHNTEQTPNSDEDLPIDSDLDLGRGRGLDGPPAGYKRPVHLQWRYLGLVAGGGTVGTALREALSIIVPAVDGVSVIILAINVVGALALGVLLEALVRRGADEGWRRTLRLLLGTGVLGGFTTYSALAADSGALLTNGRTGAAIVYALATVILGAAATFTGITLATFAHRRPSSPTSAEAA